MDAYEHFQAGMRLLESGNPAQACVRLEKVRAEEPGKASVHEALGRTYFQLGRMPEAEAAFRAVLDIAPTNDYAHYCLGRVLTRQGQVAEAEVHLKLARAMNPAWS